MARLGIAVVSVLLLALPAASAQRDTYDEAVAVGGYWYEALTIPDRPTPYAVEAEVLSGPVMNVFLLDQENYHAFSRDEPFQAYHGLQELGAVRARFAHTFTAPGTYYLVVDNYDYAKQQDAPRPSNVRMTSILDYNDDPPRPLRPGEHFVHPNEWLFEGWDVSSVVGSSLLRLDIVVLEGAPVNVYFVTADNLERAQRDEPFASYRGMQWQGVRGVQETIAVRDAGSYFVLVDAARPDRGVREGSILTIGTQALSPAASAEAPGPALALALAALAVVAALRRR